MGASLAKIKESYGVIINQIVESLSMSIDALQGECDQLSEENGQFKDRNAFLE